MVSALSTAVQEVDGFAESHFKELIEFFDCWFPVGEPIDVAEDALQFHVVPEHSFAVQFVQDQVHGILGDEMSVWPTDFVANDFGECTGKSMLFRVRPTGTARGMLPQFHLCGKSA
ncbi:MAG: hypothetical protein HYV27_23165 [Candidatus Hydrogenedentes bacterium]|nr:hypothetical protein [Candidatus Hydrogenedentota bacterium]